jgi:DNA-binding transcriptional LysR family regulator
LYWRIPAARRNWLVSRLLQGLLLRLVLTLLFSAMNTNIPDNFDWGALRSFLAVARAGKLTVAAHQLGLDHSTLSRRIQNLEMSLQATLFDRRAQGYSLTTQGVTLVQLAEKMEGLALHIAVDVGRSRVSAEGTVRIGTTDGFGTMFLASCLPKLRDLHPKLSAELVTLPTVISLSKREADIAIGLSPPTEGRLHARKLTDFEWGLFASKAYLDAHPPIVNVASLHEHRLIGYIDDLVHAPQLESVLSVLKDAEVSFSSSSLMAQFEAAKAGYGLCVLPHYMACKDGALTRVLSSEISVIGAYWMTLHSDMRELAKIRVVCDFIAKSVHAMRKQFLPQ